MIPSWAEVREVVVPYLPAAVALIAVLVTIWLTVDREGRS